MQQNYRRLLQEQVNEDPVDASLPATIPIKGSFKPTSSLNLSMALTILVILIAFFFLGFFSIYIRRFAEEETAEVRRRRHPSPPSSSLHTDGGNNNSLKGLDSSTVKALPLVSYSGATKHMMIDDCTICLSEFQEGETVKLIPYCRHVFHPACVDTWLLSHVSCPLCRSKQFFKDVDEEKNDNSTSDPSDVLLTVDDGDTSREVVSSGLRRSCSYSSLECRLVLQRSMSF